MSNQSNPEKPGKMTYVFPAVSFIGAVIFVQYAVLGVQAQLGPLGSSANPSQMMASAGPAPEAGEVEMSSVSFRCEDFAGAEPGQRIDDLEDPAGGIRLADGR